MILSRPLDTVVDIVGVGIVRIVGTTVVEGRRSGSLGRFRRRGRRHRPSRRCCERCRCRCRRRR